MVEALNMECIIYKADAAPVKKLLYVSQCPCFTWIAYNYTYSKITIIDDAVPYCLVTELVPTQNSAVPLK